jgi:predicted nucleic acid-binding protein
METYADLGFVDTTVVAIAERLRVPSIATTDRRHFSTVRPAHRDRFVLVP